MEVVDKKKLDCYQTLISFLNFAYQKLLQAEVASPRLDAEILMADNLAISRTELMTYPERLLTHVEADNFLAKIERRALREPVSHITGVKEFWSLEFSVNKKVLIPRPETEILVDQCLKVLGKNSSPARILDLGSGSGILAIVLAKEFPHSKITAIEKSLESACSTKSIGWISFRISKLKMSAMTHVSVLFCFLRGEESQKAG